MLCNKSRFRQIPNILNLGKNRFTYNFFILDRIAPGPRPSLRENIKVEKALSVNKFIIQIKNILSRELFGFTKAAANTFITLNEKRKANRICGIPLALAIPVVDQHTQGGMPEAFRIAHITMIDGWGSTHASTPAPSTYVAK